MNRQYVKVYIEWINKTIKLSEVPSESIRFYPQIRFEEEGDIMPKWTAEIIIKKFNDNSSCCADLTYLFKCAPKYLLKKGKKFLLFDGPNAIAKGEVLTSVLKD